MVDASDEQLMARIRARDAEAFEQVFERLRPGIRRHLQRIVRSSAVADDLLQEVFLCLWTRADQWRGRGTVKAWLYRIATNLAINHLRSARSRKRRPLRPSPPEGAEGENLVPGWMIDNASLGPQAVAERRERHGRLHRMIEELPEEKRDVIRLIYQEQMDVRSAAEALDIPEGTVKSRLFYARRDLAQKWEEEQ
ncbi:MAG: RNA polymerase sigma factor [Candidatus Brocadiia bacterium]